jgi:hypothetical protein
MSLGQPVDKSMGNAIPYTYGPIGRTAGEDPAIARAAEVIDTSSVVLILVEGCEAIQCLQVIQANGLMRGAYQ